MRMGYNSITDTIKIDGYIVHHQMLAIKILKTWLLSHVIAIQMPAEHGDSTAVLAHICVLF